MKGEFPVYSMNNFETSENDDVFYVNYLSPHVKAHHFTELPHKHDFYLTVLITHGSGRHEVDFESYDVAPGVMFMLKPGQMHFWKFSDDIDGVVFFHSTTFFDEGYLTTRIKDFEFFASLQNEPIVHLEGQALLFVESTMKLLIDEYLNDLAHKRSKIRAIINLIYIEVSRNYIPVYQIENRSYLAKVREFEELIENNFKQSKFTKDYAQELNISEKHLNRIVKNCLNKTSSSLIQERVLLEAKRMLMYSELNVSEISTVLGFNESSYFIRFFKKKTGQTPLGFVNFYLKR